MADDADDIETPRALVESAALNGELIDLCTRFQDQLFDWMNRAIAGQPLPRKVALKVAVSEVAFALTDRLLYPTYLSFPQLLPVELASRTDAAATGRHIN